MREYLYPDNPTPTVESGGGQKERFGQAYGRKTVDQGTSEQMKETRTDKMQR